MAYRKSISGEEALTLGTAISQADRRAIDFSSDPEVRRAWDDAGSVLRRLLFQGAERRLEAEDRRNLDGWMANHNAHLDYLFQAVRQMVA